MHYSPHKINSCRRCSAVYLHTEERKWPYCSCPEDCSSPRSWSHPTWWEAVSSGQLHTSANTPSYCLLALLLLSIYLSLCYQDVARRKWYVWNWGKKMGWGLSSACNVYANRVTTHSLFCISGLKTSDTEALNKYISAKKHVNVNQPGADPRA